MESIDLIREFLEERLSVAPGKVTPEAQLEALGIDSLMMLELMFAFEDRFGITLVKNLRTPRTVGEMIETMERLRKENA